MVVSGRMDVGRNLIASSVCADECCQFLLPSPSLWSRVVWLSDLKSVALHSMLPVIEGLKTTRAVHDLTRPASAPSAAVLTVPVPGLS